MLLATYKIPPLVYQSIQDTTTRIPVHTRYHSACCLLHYSMYCVVRNFLGYRYSCTHKLTNSISLQVVGTHSGHRDEEALELDTIHHSPTKGLYIIYILTGHTSGVRSVAFSPDGCRIVSGSEDNNTIRVWDGTTGSSLMTLTGHTEDVRSVAFSPDGRRIVSGSYDKTIHVWNGTTGSSLMTLTGHTDYVVSVAFSPDGRRIVSGSSDSTIRVWDGTTGSSLITLTGHTECSSVARP